MTKAWDTYETTIKSLYGQHTLSTVRQMMMDKFGFKASTRAYRGRLDRWGVTKYNIKKRKDRVRSPHSGSSVKDLGSSALSPALHRHHPSSKGVRGWKDGEGIAYAAGRPWFAHSNQGRGSVCQPGRSVGKRDHGRQIPVPTPGSGHTQHPHYPNPVASPFWQTMGPTSTMDHVDDDGDTYGTRPQRQSAATHYSNSYLYPLGGHEHDEHSPTSASNAGSPYLTYRTWNSTDQEDDADHVYPGA